jgi:hypothetical protein
MGPQTGTRAQTTINDCQLPIADFEVSLPQIANRQSAIGNWQFS